MGSDCLSDPQKNSSISWQHPPSLNMLQPVKRDPMNQHQILHLRRLREQPETTSKQLEIQTTSQRKPQLQKIQTTSRRLKELKEIQTTSQRLLQLRERDPMNLHHILHQRMQ